MFIEKGSRLLSFTNNYVTHADDYELYVEVGADAIYQ